MNPELEPYLQATIESSNRSRYVTFIITFISMIILGGFWNSQQFSWFKIANDLNECVYIYINLFQDKKEIPSKEVDTIQSINTKFEKLYPKKFKACERHIKTVIDNGVYSFSPDMIAIEKKIIEDNRKFHYNNYINNVGNISAHFFHENFHINDLPILSGISFTILLSILTFSYRREHRNLRKFFSISHKLGNLRKSYNILAMHQVLTVTPSLSVKKSEATDRIANTVPKLLFLIPLILEALIVYDTFATYELVIAYSHTATIINVAFGLLFAGMVGVLTIFCFVISIQIDQVWQDTAEQIRNLKINNK